jgi:hypothetical protein
MSTNIKKIGVRIQSIFQNPRWLWPSLSSRTFYCLKMNSTIMWCRHNYFSAKSFSILESPLTNMCKHIRLHLALECRAPQCRNRHMEIFKCEVNFKDIWKIVLRIFLGKFEYFLAFFFQTSDWSLTSQIWKPWLQQPFYLVLGIQLIPKLPMWVACYQIKASSMLCPRKGDWTWADQDI